MTRRCRQAGPLAPGSTGLTLLELLVAIALLGVVVLVGNTLIQRMIGSANKQKQRGSAEITLRQYRDLLVRRFEMRMPGGPMFVLPSGGSRVSGGTVPPLLPGVPWDDFGTRLSIERLRTLGSDTIVFQTKCEAIPLEVQALLDHAGITAIKQPLGRVLLAKTRRSLGNLCRAGSATQAALTCPLGFRPTLRVERFRKEPGVAAKPGAPATAAALKDIEVAVFPKLKERATILAGGFCFTRSSAFEYLVAFQQVILEDNRIVHLKSDALLTLSDDDPYSVGRGGGITYLAPGE